MEVQLDGSVTAVSDLGAQELPALEWWGVRNRWLRGSETTDS